MSSLWSNPVLRVRALTEVADRRKRPTTFTEPLTKSPDMKEFLQDFYKNVYKEEKKQWYRAEREKYPLLQKNYLALCEKSVSFEDFWQRYEYRCNLERVMKELSDKDAAQVEQTKKSVSEYIHQAWSTGSTSPTASTTQPTPKEVKATPAPTPEASEVAVTPASSTIRDSLTKAWTNVAGTPSKEEAPVPAKSAEQPSKQPLKATFTKNRKALHGVKQTQGQNALLREFNARQERKRKVAPPTPPPTPVTSSSTLSVVSDEKDGSLADTLALLLVLLFVILTNLPIFKTRSEVGA